VNQIARDGGKVLFVGTKPSLHQLVVKTATENNAFYSIHWLGGTITNKERVLRRTVGYDPDKVSQSLLPQETKDILEKDGLLEESMGFLEKQPYVHEPDLLILLDYPNTKWACMEANKAEIPVVAICDSDCDAGAVQYPIPANDDSMTGVELIAGVLGRACREGYAHFHANEKKNSRDY
jgi:small subunit ribosomal protein S2